MPVTFLLTRNNYSYLRYATDVHHAPLHIYAMPQSEKDTSLKFQLDGFHPHYANTVFESFSRHICVDKLGDGPVSWPPTSPYLTPMIFDC